MPETASDYFDAMVAEYDSLIRRAVPRYDEMIERLLEYGPDRATRILELGCGSGNLTEALARRYPGAELTVVDGASGMLAVAAARGERCGARVRRVEAYFEALELEPGAYDLVTSCMALHHVREKGPLFRRLHGFVRPGGALVFADQMRGRTDVHHELNWRRMTDFWELPGHLDRTEQASLVEHAQAHDHYAPIVEQLQELDEAGFREIDCVWRNWMWGIVTAQRPR